jgi:hypothetical protein
VSFVRLAPSPNAVHPDVRPFVLAQKVFEFCWFFFIGLIRCLFFQKKG